MSDITAEFAKFRSFRTHSRIEARAHGGLLQVKPVAITVRASCSVVAELVIGVGNPETSWSLISIKKTPTALGLNDQVVLNQILGLCSILDEDAMAHSVVRYVVLDFEVVNSVDGDSTVVRLVDGIVAHVGLVHSSNHVEMDWISSQLEGLTDIGELTVLNATDDRFIARRVQHNVSAKLVCGRCLRVTSVLDVASQ